MTSITSSIPKDAYNGSTKLIKKVNGVDVEITEVTIPNSPSITSIGSNAFAGCTTLRKIIIPNTVTTIGAGCFSGCTSLEEVVFEQNSTITTLGNNLFKNCSSLETINFPVGLQTIGSNTFEGCNLGDVSLPSSVYQIGDSCFADAGVTSINLENITSCGKSAFCQNLFTEITLPDSWSATPWNGFSSCKQLVTVNLGSNIHIIDNWSFQSCTALTTVNFNYTGSISVGGSAFSGCTYLRDLTNFWGQLSSVGAKGFLNCISLTGEKIIPAGCVIDETAFQGCSSNLDVHQ